MTILIAPDPVPTGLRISAYRPPESGYARLVPDTWRRSATDPTYVSGPRLRTMNTGWGPIWEAGSNIGSGRTIRVPWVTGDVASGGAGTVEVGGFYPLGSDDPDLWCCGTMKAGGAWCDAEECDQLDLEAAIGMAEAAGGGVVLDEQGAPVAVVAPSGETLQENDPGFVETVTEVMQLEELPAVSKKGKGKKKPDPNPYLTPAEPSPTGDWPTPAASPLTTQRATAGMNPVVLLGGLALVAGAWWFMRDK